MSAVLHEGEDTTLAVGQLVHLIAEHLLRREVSVKFDSGPSLGVAAGWSAAFLGHVEYSVFDKDDQTATLHFEGGPWIRIYGREDDVAEASWDGKTLDVPTMVGHVLISRD